MQLAIEYGASESLARQFPVFTAVSGCIGRLTAGVVADSKIVNIVSYFQCILFLIGIISIIAAFSYTKTHVLVYVWVYAFIEGQVNVTMTPITRDLVGLTYLSEGFSLLLAVIAIPVMLGPPLIGMHAFVQNYSFYLAEALLEFVKGDGNFPQQILQRHGQTNQVFIFRFVGF